MPSSSTLPLFNRLYADVDREIRQSLLDFRDRNTPRTSRHEGFFWRYISLGEGPRTVLFLPGAAGAYDIFWRQLIALAGDFRLISVSYPPISDLNALRSGLNAILAQEQVSSCHIIGSSMGGYLAQYIACMQPDRVDSIVLANTFVPTSPVLRSAPMLRAAILSLPLPVLLSAFRRLTLRRLAPAGENHPLLRAYLMEVSYSGLGKNDMLARLDCVRQPFIPLPPEAQLFPMLIIDADNDPLIQPHIRRSLPQLYPAARHHSFANAGHFSYINQADAFTAVLQAFFQEQ